MGCISSCTKIKSMPGGINPMNMGMDSKNWCMVHLLLSMVHGLWSMFHLIKLPAGCAVIICMIKTIIPKDLQVKSATSTPVEAFLETQGRVYLNVSLSQEMNTPEKSEKAFAKMPGGEIVEIAFTNSPGQGSSSIEIHYYI